MEDHQQPDMVLSLVRTKSNHQDDTRDVPFCCKDVYKGVYRLAYLEFKI